MLNSSFSTATLFFFFFFFFWLFSSCEKLHFPTRRILHEPYSTLSYDPPSSPTTPKYPLSSSSATSPPGSPFFPTFPFAPPPPTPATFASFPANISSLVIPHTPAPKHNSQKLLIVSVAGVLSASVIAGIIVFVYCRRRNKTITSDNSGSFNFYHNENNNNVGVRKQRATSTTSSEFLYLGTVVNSQGRFDDGSNDSQDNTGLDPGKMYSPELRPLPHLSRLNTGRNYRNGGVESVVEDDGDEEEEFYSPRGSLGGRESSTGIGSGSRRVYTAIDVKTTESSSTCSYSSSSSGSPARSQSLSISPPVSLSPRPRIPDRKTPEPLHIQPHLSPERMLIDSPRVSDASINGHIRSPSLSLISTSPERVLVKESDDRSVQSPSSSSPNRVLIEKLDASIQNFKDFVQNMKVPLILASAGGANSQAKHAPSNGSSVFSASTSPERALNEDKQQSSLLTSPSPWPPNVVIVERPEMSPLEVDSSDYNKAPSFSSLASSSPERCLEKSPDASPLRLSKALRKPILSPPPPPPLPKQRRLWEKPVSSVPFAQQISKPPVPPPPPRRLWEKPVSSVPIVRQMPPPPPPPPKQRMLWAKPVLSVPSAQQISKPPPPLTPSSTTFNVSPLEVPSMSASEAIEESEEGSKPKLKPLHWDKVKANSDREMVWDHLRSSSFKLNEEMIETLFVVNTPISKPKQTTPPSVVPSPNQENRVLDPQKAQNIAILLKALNVTVEEVSEVLLECNADKLGTELLESLSRMAPTKEEECKLKEYRDDSPVKLGPAEKFLKTVLDIPFAFKRVDAMLYIANFESEVEYVKNSFETLEAACEELRNSRMFLKLLEAVLKTGNRMNVGTNRGDAQAFKLDTLLKLADVKGADGKTTLLHFVVQEIIRTEGARLSNANQSTTTSSTLTEDARCRKLGLQVVSDLSSELTNVKKAATMDSEVLSGDVSKLSRGIELISEVLRLNNPMGSDDSKEKFSESMNRFMKMAEHEIPRIQAHENVALSLVKEITEYFHGNSAQEEAHPFRIFLVVRDFLTVLDRVCKEIGLINERTIVSSAHKFPVPVNPIMQQTFPVPVNPMMQQVFPGFQGNPHYGSDDETAST